jgi:hypothetical protein
MALTVKPPSAAPPLEGMENARAGMHDKCVRLAVIANKERT